jgi:hypothetical protein
MKSHYPLLIKHGWLEISWKKTEVHTAGKILELWLGGFPAMFDYRKVNPIHIPL